MVVDIRSAVEVSDDAVEKMLEESLEHAFEDVEQRQFTESEIKADEILAAVAQAMGQFRDSMSVEEIAQIEGLAAEVKSARAERSLQKLKKSLAELDDATHGARRRGA